MMTEELPCMMKESVEPQSREPLLNILALDVALTARAGKAYILKDINFEVHSGETVCLVGESGCGKSMTALAIMQLMPEKVSIPAGAIYLHGEDLAQCNAAEMSRMRGNKISMIFQEPMTALNPVYTVGDQISEPLRRHQGMSREQARAKTLEILQSVGIPAPEQRIDNYPHEMSGGMRQRVMIAMAMACDPDVLIADEPTTALDVTVQAQIFDLLREQQERRGTAIVMITHDMGAVAEMSDRVVVMYGGRVVEEGATDQVLSTPCHPYTKGLISCLPELDPAPTQERPDLPEIAGVVPSIWERGKGCPFVDRCGAALEQCSALFPPSFKIAPTQSVACWLYGEQA